VTKKDVDALRIIEPEEDLSFVMEAVKRTSKALADRVPLIGFAGGPFTLASYMIEGGHSRNFIATKKLMYHEPSSWHLLMEKLAQVTGEHLKAQIKSGAHAVQLFDSWVGCLGPKDYAEFVLPYSRHVFDTLHDTTPAIHFGTGTSTLLELMQKAGGTVIGVDWRIELGEAWRRVGYDVGIQGNLDPVTLFAPIPVIRKKVKEMITAADNHPGHIFNLGHGILPKTPVEHVTALVEAVHEFSQR
jgi:uroporphyrinogen decarboxylase